MSGQPSTNRLVHEKSPYLLQHAHNPVDWFPWGEEAFAKARKESKPIFLSIGYSTCHWCHVMEHESFENPEVAAILNRYFVSIKVDREERPDVDRVYMLFVQSTTGSGGWPMSVFLTPQLQPFLGGTYYPPEDRYGRPGFSTLIQRLAGIWQQHQDKVIDQGQQFTRALTEALAKKGAEPADSVRSEWLETAYRQIASGFDPEEGGFGSAPKFPRPAQFDFLFRYWARTGSSSPLDMTLFTLRKMAAGGMYDQLGGGFHRYSVDERWHVPHFEKMLYDQAQLVSIYTAAYQITRDTLFARVVDETLAYLARDLAAPEGGFYSAEDADSLPSSNASEKKEGAFYVWTDSEINSVLSPDESLVFRRSYGVEKAGNVRPASDPQGELSGQNVLFRQNDTELVAKLTGKSSSDVEKLLASARKKLFQTRSGRPRPHLDDKIIVAWNGLVLSALAHAYQVFRNAEHLQQAQKTAGFIRDRLYAGRLLRSYRQGPSTVPGFAEDYAFLIQGLLDLYEADFDYQWLRWAIELQGEFEKRFADPAGGFFNTEGDATDILFRLKDDHDGAEPSANSVAAMNLIRLSRILGRSDFELSAKRAVGSFQEMLDSHPVAMPQMLGAVDALLSDPIQIVIATHSPADDPLLRVAQVAYQPRRILLQGGETEIAQQVPELRGMDLIDGRSAAYVCRNFACELPITEPKVLAEELAAVR
ncbi:MAG TPA: thioredoxin domain-containing protein [Chthoniobacterales bacterium]|nr:thioredoxin domain-containing protein [Chthoniobacterales bacterium]